MIITKYLTERERDVACDSYYYIVVVVAANHYYYHHY